MAFLPLLVPAAIMLIPYADLLMAVIRRTRAGTSVFTPDKKHLQHRLLAIGHSHRTSVLILYLWAALFAGSVVWLSIVRTSLYILIIVTGAAVLALALLLISMPRLRPRVLATAGNGVVGRPAPAVSDAEGTAEPRPALAAAGADLRTAPARGPAPAPPLGPAAWPGTPPWEIASALSRAPRGDAAPSPKPASGSASWFEPVKPSGRPNGSASPSGSGQPAESAQPSGSSQPPESAQPAESAQASGSGQPAESSRPNASPGPARPGQPGRPNGPGAADEPAAGDRWSLPSFPAVDPRRSASLQDRR